MGQRQLNRLSARTIATKKRPGLYCDGGGLYLQLSQVERGDGTMSPIYRSWIFRYTSPVTKKARYMSLGALHSVGLPEARQSAETQRGLLSQGLDPIQVRDEEIARKAAEAASAVTFAQCATAYVESHKAGWRNAKHAEQWTYTLDTYAGPVIGELPVQDVDTALVLRVLEPIWSAKPETASRLRGRIENVLDWAKARGHRVGENPARWRGHLNQLLPALAKKERVTHHAAMPFSEVGAFITRLRATPGVVARCLEFTILTAARTNEAINAKPEEFDLERAAWTVPHARMKAKKEHRVPLSPRAAAIVREMLELKGDYVFPTNQRTKSISNMAMLTMLGRMKVNVTVHGFRSSFRDWAAERTAFPHEVCEMALAHTISNAAEAAYRRGDLLDKRRKLMDAWAEYIDTPQQDCEVIPLRNAA
jgi:integrase